MPHLLPLLALAALLHASAACIGGPEGDGDAPSTDASAGNDAKGDDEVDGGGGVDAALPNQTDAGLPNQVDAAGEIDAGEDIDAGGGGELGLRNVYGVVNADDDDSNGAPDWYDDPFASDGDYSTFTLPNLPGHSIELALSGDDDSVRIWDGSNNILLGDNFNQPTITSTTVAADGSTLYIEFGYYLVHGVLDARLLDGSNIEVDAEQLDLWSAPLILNHHLQASEHVYVVNFPFGGANNVAMVDGYRSVLANNEFTAVPESSVDGDRWMQDEIEFATSVGDEGQRVDTVIDSIRDRGLDVFPEEQFSGPGYYVGTWGQGEANTYDSFGNFEVSPPVTVGGVHYPYGRAYYGDIGNQGPNGTLGAFLESQQVQDPFTLNTSWLYVGHIDEVSTWIPDPSSALGYKLLMADVPSALALIDSLDPALEIPRYAASGFDVAGDLQDDIAFRNENLDIQDDYLTPTLNIFKAATGITEADVIRVPALFEDAGGGMAALIPGTVNLIVADAANDQTHLFFPDPSFRDVVNQGADPFIAAFNALWPAGITPTYLDVWYSYHALLGEVHCGSNVERTPVGNWWQNAMHLVEAN